MENDNKGGLFCRVTCNTAAASFMTQERRKLGKKGEDLAVAFLKKKHYRILFRNYRCRFGEIDIIAVRKNRLSFIEVKTRTSISFGLPQEAVSCEKQRKISMVAMEFIQKYSLESRDAGFDIIAILCMPDGYRFEFIEDAFELERD